MRLLGGTSAHPLGATPASAHRRSHGRWDRSASTVLGMLPVPNHPLLQCGALRHRVSTMPSCVDHRELSGCPPNESRLSCGRKTRGRSSARSFYATGQGHKRNSSLLGRARQLQALVRRQPFKNVGSDSALL